MKSCYNGDYAIYRLAAIKGTKYIPVDGYGLFKRVCRPGFYDETAITPPMSILGGVLWYAVRNGDHNGGGDPLYMDKVNFTKGEMV